MPHPIQHAGRHAAPRPLLLGLAVAALVVVSGCADAGAGNSLVGNLPPLTDDTPDAAAAPDLGSDVTPDDTPDAGAPSELDAGSTPLAVGHSARVTAGSLNLRSGAGTMNPVLAVMHCGDAVRLTGGPDGYWWQIEWSGPNGAKSGWASGNYLVAAADFDASLCMLPGMTDGGVPADGGMNADQVSVLARARLGVGYSYYWGHGSWRADGQSPGACMGSCPNCSHTGQYGADCSGFVAKCWQIPSPSPITTDLHPYSTWNFYNQKTHWAPLPRGQIQPADSLVYNANGSGHMVLFESGNDPWGSVWTYEARGCATGIVHNLRVVSSDYITIRREGL